MSIAETIKAKIKASTPYIAFLVTWQVADTNLRIMYGYLEDACGELEQRGAYGYCRGGSEFGVVALACVAAGVAVGIAVWYLYARPDDKKTDVP